MEQEEKQQQDDRVKQIVPTNCEIFTISISKIYNTQVNDAKDFDVAMSM